MKKTLTLAAIGTFMLMGVAQSNAQTTNTNIITFVTNLEQTVTITLSGFIDTSATTNGGTASPTKIQTKDVIADIGAVQGATFSSKAKLMLVTFLESGETGFFIRDGTGNNFTDTAVAGLLSVETIGAPVQKSKAGSNGKVTGTQYSIERFTYGGADTNAVTGFTFDVQGFTTTSLVNGGLTSQVNGNGSELGAAQVLKGTIKASPGKLRTIQITVP